MMDKNVSLVCLLMVAGVLPAADLPSAELSNGQLRVKVYLPDARNGYYRGTRYDWSGVIGALEYKGHNFYAPWFARVDEKIHDYGFVGPDVLAAPCAAMTGPAEEFQTNGKALGWDEAKAGGTFIKIGIGVLRKDDKEYDHNLPYQIVDPGKWSVEKRGDSIVFTQELTDPSSGYGYVYRKTVQLTRGKPEMVLAHTLKNTGRRAIQSTVYNHNFLVLDNQPPGPDFSVTVPFQIQTRRPPNKELFDIRGNQLVFLKTLAGEDVAQSAMRGFGTGPADNEIRIENRKVGAGMKVAGDRPLTNVGMFSTRTVLAVEPFIAMNIEPGAEFAWKSTYQYFTLSK
jgi:hypothetical protein